MVPKGPLIFHASPAAIEEVDEQPFAYPEVQSLGAPTMHQFPDERRQSALHVYGQSPSLASSRSVVVLDTPKKKRWWKRVFGGEPKKKTPRAARLGGGKLKARPRKAKDPPPEHVLQLGSKRSQIFVADWD